MQGDNDLSLDVVIITKNQGWNVRRLVESVLRETESLPRTDVILVDSASTDDTVYVAQEFPIRVIRLSKRQRLTAAAGRQAGITQTSGDVVLFLDGDMELRHGWIAAALRVFKKEPSVAVISGQVVDQPRVTKESCGPARPLSNTPVLYDTVPHGGGAAAYRRRVLEKVGSFNPYLFSDEEPELCLRIREAGYRVVKLRMPIADHYSDPAGAISTLFGRRKRNLYLGPGQALRLHAGTRMLMPYARERGFGLVPSAGVAAGLACATLALSERDLRWAAVWLGSVVAIFGVDSVRKRSPHRALFAMVQRILFAEGTVRGFLMRPSDPTKFPYMIEVIK
ncbi:MAG: glycosyltransferase [Nitrolancea sp.]